jgi:hypothetical protein
MTMSSLDRRHRQYAPFFDTDPVTGRSIEVFYADRTLETFGKGGAGWFWHVRRSGLAPEGAARGPFPTPYLVLLDAVQGRTDPPQFGRRIVTTSIEC